VNIFGDCKCSNCELETRFLIEEGEQDVFLLLGDSIKEIEVDPTISQVIECDYCQKPFRLYVVLVEGVISAFLNQNEYELFKIGETQISKANMNEGLKKEKNLELIQFDETFYTPFREQPYESTTDLTINGAKWEILKTYKKESVETDLARRLVSPSLDEYWYKVQNSKGVKKWCIVTDTETEYERINVEKENTSFDIKALFEQVKSPKDWFELNMKQGSVDKDSGSVDNAILTLSPPYLRDNEKKFDITEAPRKTKLLFEEKLGENMFMRAYEYIAGVRLCVYNKEGELELDVFSDSSEGAMDIVQEQWSTSVGE
jgi:hypothetical protein